MNRNLNFTCGPTPSKTVGGKFTVNCSFENAVATEDSPFTVTGGTLRFVATSGWQNRVPKNAYIVVDGQNAVLEVEGNNTLPRGDPKKRRWPCDHNLQEQRYD